MDTTQRASRCLGPTHPKRRDATIDRYGPEAWGTERKAVQSTGGRDASFRSDVGGCSDVQREAMSAARRKQDKGGLTKGKMCVYTLYSDAVDSSRLSRPPVTVPLISPKRLSQYELARSETRGEQEDLGGRAWAETVAFGVEGRSERCRGGG